MLKTVLGGAAAGAGMLMLMGWVVSTLGSSCSFLCLPEVSGTVGALAGAWGGWSAHAGGPA